MNTLTDILATPYGWMVLAFSYWWGWLIWLAAVAIVAVAYRRQLIVAVGRIVNALRRRGR